MMYQRAILTTEHITVISPLGYTLTALYASKPNSAGGLDMWTVFKVYPLPLLRCVENLFFQG